MPPSIQPVVLSGGSGSRLWPLSREQYPKQLLALVSDRTLLQETVRRLDALTGAAAPVVVCNEAHRFMVAEQLRQLGGSPAHIILEPDGRNTAPALTLAALTLQGLGQDPVMLVMPADHVIQDNAVFLQVVRLGAELAEQGRLVTFGIVPDVAETGYGYIKKGAALGAGLDAWQVAAFVEKPDTATAGQYLQSGQYLWNSGIFMMRPSVWLEELQRHRPDIARACQDAMAGAVADGDFIRAERAAFGACPSDSIDYAVMEKTARAVVVPMDAGWSDIGAWSALSRIIPQDSAGNVIRGDVMAHATRNTTLMAGHRFLAVVGLEDIIVVETADAVLVAHRDHAQAVKDIVARLKSEQRDEYKIHRKVYRPWGSYEGVDAGPGFQVKRLIVNPGAALSLQLHHRRAEHWVVVNGTAKVTRGEEVFTLMQNQSTYIPPQVKHRLENPGTQPLEMIEVQSGDYLGEDDIVRFEDIYNRCENP
ncbi:MAG: mannose-1-phosphate guanylyltransferase/mannose-6-phosphate isomerase [Gammaproteobacteria bacterium]|nr:mannose-1-phosphate guanylyltransferase/mannose-6-phosphate isomerase [Gammaproteobacteria bacterium]